MILLPALGLLALASIPLAMVLFVLVVFQRMSEWRFRRGMSNIGRVKPWRSVAEDAVAGRGTIIVETINKGPTRLWWTDKKVVDEFGAEPPKLDVFELVSGQPQSPFSVYCWRRYLDPRHGSAFLIHPEPDLSKRGWTHHHLRAQFPDARVVETLHLRTIPD
jgi:hypothetical protein